MSAGALLVGVWMVLVALFAMHGLPMQSPADMTMAAPAASAMAMPGHDAEPADGASTALADANGSPTLSDPAPACGGSDHCTATLRTADAAAIPAVVDVVSRTTHPLDSSAQLVSPMPTARPPDLDTLQISRT